MASLVYLLFDCLFIYHILNLFFFVGIEIHHLSILHPQAAHVLNTDELYFNFGKVNERKKKWINSHIRL